MSKVLNECFSVRTILPYISLLLTHSKVMNVYESFSVPQAVLAYACHSETCHIESTVILLLVCCEY